MSNSFFWPLLQALSQFISPSKSEHTHVFTHKRYPVLVPVSSSYSLDLHEWNLEGYPEAEGEFSTGNIWSKMRWCLWVLWTVELINHQERDIVI